jgi:hypothetical protein
MLKSFIAGVAITVCIMNPVATAAAFNTGLTTINHMVAPEKTYSANILGNAINLTVPK